MGSKIKSVLNLAWPYLAIALLPVLSVLILSSQIAKNYTDEIVADRQRSVISAVDRVSRKVTSVEELSYMVAQSNSLSSYVLGHSTGSEDLLESARNLRDLLMGVSKNENVAEAYFYDGFIGRIIASSTILDDASIYFRYQYVISGRTPEEVIGELDNMVWSSGFSGTLHVVCDSRPMDVIEYRLTVPINQSIKNPSTLAISLNTQVLFQDLADLAGDGTAYYIFDGDRLIYASSDEYSDLTEAGLGGELSAVEGADGVYGIARSCNDGRWIIKYFCPDPIRESNVGSIVITLLPTVLLVIASLSLCVFFTHKNNREISELLGLLRGEEGSDAGAGIEYADLKTLHTYANRAAYRNRFYHEKLQEMQKSQRASVLRQLLHGSYANEDNRHAAIATLELQETGNRFAVLCIQLGESAGEYFGDGYTGFGEMILDLLENNIGLDLETVNTSSYEMVCILNSSDNLALANEIISLLSVRIKYQYNVDLQIGVGAQVDSLEDINLSYEQAMETIRFSENTGKNLHFYSQADISDKVVYYPEQTDDKISNYTIAGLADEANAVITDIYVKNFVENNRLLTPEAISLLKMRISSAVLSVADRQDISLSEEARAFMHEKDVKKFFASLKRAITEMVGNITEKKSGVQNTLAVSINDYIREHYTESGLNIKQIAWNFHFHENYISNLYRKEYGINLSSAIEKLRIDRACELLATSDIRVGEVAEAVGYSLDSSFRRAFKKITGVSPAEYRSLHEGGK